MKEELELVPAVSQGRKLSSTMGVVEDETAVRSLKSTRGGGAGTIDDLGVVLKGGTAVQGGDLVLTYFF